MNKQPFITALLALVAIAGQGQTSFDTGEGCLTKGFRLLPICVSMRRMLELMRNTPSQRISCRVDINAHNLLKVYYLLK